MEIFRNLLTSLTKLLRNNLTIKNRVNLSKSRSVNSTYISQQTGSGITVVKLSFYLDFHPGTLTYEVAQAL